MLTCAHICIQGLARHHHINAKFSPDQGVGGAQRRNFRPISTSSVPRQPPTHHHILCDWRLLFQFCPSMAHTGVLEITSRRCGATCLLLTWLSSQVARILCGERCKGCPQQNLINPRHTANRIPMACRHIRYTQPQALQCVQHIDPTCIHCVSNKALRHTATIVGPRVCTLSSSSSSLLFRLVSVI